MVWSLLAQTVAVAPRGYMPAESLFSDYTAAAVAAALVVGALVVILVGGGLLILNLGLMSKRPEDRVEAPEPGDVRLLQSTLHPGFEESERLKLPAQDQDDEDEHRDEGEAA